ncbi:MAG: hypothetical protein MJZ20_02725 [Bacteroidaceae bacterium]|nr:hypothetical protein [Bacteroidaceae bacterium]
MTGNSSIVCQNSIRIGKDCLMSWDVLVMDSDFHQIIDRRTGKEMNPAKEIVIGEKCWICCRCSVLKGAEIGNHTVLASGSKIAKAIQGSNCVIGVIDGCQKTILNDIDWIE